jgi:ABC-type lipoprotein release transport system permease subunit
MFAVSILILLIPVLLAALRPALRAANMDPMLALRAE